jgi:16S rRNA (uracil1498-N3)-methyltransferase
MELFYTDQFTPGQTHLTLSVEESLHISRVLRKKSGDSIHITDGKGHLISGEISNQSGRQITIKVANFEISPFPSSNRIELGVAIIRPNRMDWIIEKATELGIQKLVPLICQYNSYQKIKKEHLRKISLSAMKQSQQTYVPEIADPINFQDWLQTSQRLEKSSFIANPTGSTKDFTNIKSPVEWPCRIAIGPEGGFTSKELELAKKNRFHKLKLGNIVLRTETAAITGLIILKTSVG